MEGLTHKGQQNMVLLGTEGSNFKSFVVVVALLFYVHGKHLRSCQDGQLT